MAGFEPAASTSQMWRDTGLRYIPKGSAKVRFKLTVANIFLNKIHSFLVLGASQKAPFFLTPISQQIRAQDTSEYFLFNYTEVVTDQLIMIKAMQMAQISPSTIKVQYIKFFIRGILVIITQN